MSKTPRTDTIIAKCNSSNHTSSFVAMMRVAMQLETELDTAHEALKRCRRVFESFGCDEVVRDIDATLKGPSDERAI